MTIKRILVSGVIVAATAATVLVMAMIDWTWPALALVRHQASPPIVAMRWIRAHVPSVGPRLYLVVSPSLQYDDRLMLLVLHPNDPVIRGLLFVADKLLDRFTLRRV